MAKNKKIKTPIIVKKNGRPSKYTKAVADKICLIISTTSKGLKTICRENHDLPSYVTVYTWLNDPKHSDFLNSYTCAKSDQSDVMADEIVEIADDSTNDTIKTEEGIELPNHEWIQRARLRVEARKWVAAKLKPKKYGDRQEIDMKVTTEQPLFPNLDAKSSKKQLPKTNTTVCFKERQA